MEKVSYRNYFDTGEQMNNNKIKEYLQKRYLGDGWWDVSSFWNKLEELGKQRDKQKSYYASTKNWSSHSTHFLGLISELTFSLETGIMLDKILRSQGDMGFDFCHDGKNFDIKGTQYWQDPHLKQYPKPKSWCDYYLLAGIKLNVKQAKIFGWASKEEIQNAKLVNYGYGPQRSISYDELHKGIPVCLPSLKAKAGVEELSAI